MSIETILLRLLSYSPYAAVVAVIGIVGWVAVQTNSPGALFTTFLAAIIGLNALRAIHESELFSDTVHLENND